MGPRVGVEVGPFVGEREGASVGLVVGETEGNEGAPDGAVGVAVGEVDIGLTVGFLDGTAVGSYVFKVGEIVVLVGLVVGPTELGQLA